MMKNLIIISSLVFFSVVAILFFVEKDNRAKIISNEKSEAESVFEDGYMDGCSDGTNMAYCKCTFDYILEDVGLREFLKLSLKYEDTGELSDVFYDSIIECVEYE